MVSLETSDKQEAESKGEDSETADTIPSGRCLRRPLLGTVIREEYFQFGREASLEEAL